MSSLWSTLGQASNVAQLAGVDAFGLVSMVVQAALAARLHRDACRRLAQHVELAGDLLRELELTVLMRRDATRRPLEQLRGALRRCYALVRSCQEDGGYFRRLLAGAWMADELRSAQHEIDMYIRLIPLIALVDTARNDHPTESDSPARRHAATRQPPRSAAPRPRPRPAGLHLRAPASRLRLPLHALALTPPFTTGPLQRSRL